MAPQNAETNDSSQDLQNNGALPAPGIESNLLISSQFTKNATTHSLLTTYEPINTSSKKKGFSGILNKKSKGISKKARKSPDGKSKYLKRGRTLFLDGPDMATMNNQ